MESNDILYSVENKIATITLNRPDNLNTMTADMYMEMIELLDKAENDDAVRVIVVTGNGRVFCAGADLTTGKKFGQQDNSIEEYRDRGGLVSLRLFKLTKPCIAAINGSAVGVGITMTLPMDIRVVSEKAKIGFVFSRRGIINEACSSYFLPRIVGVSKSLEWIMTGRTFLATEGYEAGLFTKMVEPEKVLETAYEYAREIADNAAPLSVALARRLIWDMHGTDPLTAHDFESRCMFFLGRSADAKEGVGAFMEKRAPEWSMSVTKDMPPFFPFKEDPPFRN
ncbi:MAG: Short-chain-enoyl-CoA hydratase [Desulfovibrio sp.]